jgi:hypothetical protein
VSGDTPGLQRAAVALLALDRRGFLRAAALAAGAGLLPAGCSGPSQRWAPPADLELRHLTPRTYAVLDAAAVRIVGPRGAELVRAGRIDPARNTERFLARAPALAAPLRQALLVLEFGFQPLIAKLRPFTALEAAAQDAVLADLMGSRLALKRLLFNGVRSVSLANFYGDPASAALTHYPPGAPQPGVSIASALSYEVDL